MPVSDDKRNQELNKLLLEAIEASKVEYEASLEESQRVKDIVADAASTLRACFKKIDNSVRSDDLDGEEYQQSYRSIIATLQFEDIVTQIIGHQMDRAIVMRSVLGRLQDSMQRLAEDEISPLQEEIDSLLQQFAGASAVQQKDLAVGEAELF